MYYSRSSFAHTTIYHLDCLNQTTRLLSTIIKPDAFADFAFREGWVAVGWKVEHDYFLLVRQISLVHREGEDEVLMNLKGPEVVSIVLSQSRDVSLSPYRLTET